DQQCTRDHVLGDGDAEAPERDPVPFLGVPVGPRQHPQLAREAAGPREAGETRRLGMVNRPRLKAWAWPAARYPRAGRRRSRMASAAAINRRSRSSADWVGAPWTIRRSTCASW